MFWAARAIHWWSQRVFFSKQCDHLSFSQGRERWLCCWWSLDRKVWAIWLTNFIVLGIDPWLKQGESGREATFCQALFNKLLVFNEEILVSAGHQPALTASLLFVHTARRFYWLDAMAKSSEQSSYSPLWGEWDTLLLWETLKIFQSSEVDWTLSSRRKRSRNKVSVGEPADGSLSLFFKKQKTHTQTHFITLWTFFWCWFFCLNPYFYYFFQLMKSWLSNTLTHSLTHLKAFLSIQWKKKKQKASNKKPNTNTNTHTIVKPFFIRI